MSKPTGQTTPITANALATTAATEKLSPDAAYLEAILDNTSRPIKFGQFDDPLRVIEGYINKVDIKSIIKQDASIQLKSNKILR